MTEDQAIQVLESRAGILEYKQNVFFLMMPLPRPLSTRLNLFTSHFYPLSAGTHDQAATYTHNKRRQFYCLKEEVATVVLEKKPKFLCPLFPAMNPASFCFWKKPCINA